MSVGARVRRADAASKVAGRARYVDDIRLPGMLHGKTVRSTIQRGRIVQIGFDPAFDWSDMTIVRPTDIPGENILRFLTDDQPVLAERDIRHRHEPILLIACADPYRLEEAAQRVRIEYETKPAVDSIDEALSGRIKIYGETNVFKEITIEKGEVDRVLDAAALVVEESYDTGLQEQLYIEPQGMIAMVADDGAVTVMGSLQCPYYVHRALKVVFGETDDARIRVIQCETGGGFGGKEEYPNVIAAHAALLAKKSGRPVKMIYDRAEDMAATTKRHPAEMIYRAAVAPDGRLLAVDIDICLDGGAYCTLSPVVLSRCVLHAMSAYRCDNIRIHGRAVATHTPPNGAFRGFGAPQSIFACERHIDLIATRTGLSPLAVRRVNLLRPGDATATGQILDGSASAAAVLERTVEAARYEEKRAANARAADLPPCAFPDRPAPRRGTGLSLFMHGCGFTGSGEQKLLGRVTLTLVPDARVPGGVRARVFTASTEIGQGMRTTFAQIAADALGLPYEAVEVPEQDTAAVPDSGPTVASRTCMIVGGVVAEAARALILKTSTVSGATLAERVEALVARGETPTATAVYESPKGVEWDEANYRGSAYPTYGWGAEVVDVEIDPVSYEIAVKSVITCQDVGRAVNPSIVEGQIEGGTVQALGWAASEEVVLTDGAMSNNRLSKYIIPTALDVPDITVLIHENPYVNGPFGAKGVGEMPMDGAAPAFAAAVDQATGGFFRQIPILPEVVAAHLAPARCAEERS